MAIATAAGALAQWPVGRLSDTVDRRLVLIAVLIAAAVFGLALAFLPLGGTARFVLAALFGAAIAPTYALPAAHAYDHADPGAMVETASGLFIANSAAAIIGPLIAAAAMQRFGAGALFLYTAVVHVILAAYVFARVRTRAPIAPALKTEFDLATHGPGARRAVSRAATRGNRRRRRAVGGGHMTRGMAARAGA